MPITIAAWFYVDDDGRDNTILSLANGSGTDMFAIDASSANTVRAFLYQGGWGIASSTTSYSVNTWHHAAGVFIAANNRAAFLDGGSKGTNASVRTPAGIDTVGIGRRADGTPSDYMSGRIALPAIWNCALSDAEVLWLAQGNWPHRVRPSNFCGYWLPPGVRNDYDYSGRGYHMTAYNSPTWAPDPPKVLKLR